MSHTRPDGDASIYILRFSAQKTAKVAIWLAPKKPCMSDVIVI